MDGSRRQLVEIGSLLARPGSGNKRPKDLVISIERDRCSGAFAIVVAAPSPLDFERQLVAQKAVAATPLRA